MQKLLGILLLLGGAIALVSRAWLLGIVLLLMALIVHSNTRRNSGESGSSDYSSGDGGDGHSDGDGDGGGDGGGGDGGGGD